MTLLKQLIDPCTFTQLFCKLLVKSKRNIVNSSHLICMLSLLLWYIVFFSQPHKEERFIYPAYPLICLSAAFAIEMVQKALTAVMPRLTYFYSSLVLVFVIVFAFLSISRGLALYKGERTYLFDILCAPVFQI